MCFEWDRTVFSEMNSVSAIFGTALHEHLEHLHLAHREATLGAEALAARIQTFEDRRHRSGDVQIGEDAPLREGAVVQG